MAFLGLQPAGSVKARENAERTLFKPIKLDYLKQFLSAEDFARLEQIYPDRRVFVWGVKLERAHQWGKMIEEKTLVLFRQGDRVVRAAVVTHKVINDALANFLWGPDDDGQLWSLVYFIHEPIVVDIPASAVSKAAGLDPTWNWQGFVALFPPEADNVVQVVSSYLP